MQASETTPSNGGGPSRQMPLLSAPTLQPSRCSACHHSKCSCSKSLPTSSSRAASYSTSTATTAQEPVIHDVFESKTGTWQYVVADPSTKKAVIIDPVLDYEPATQVIKTVSADSLLDLVKEKGYHIGWILETHAHADHLSAASYLQSRLSQEQADRPLIGIGKRVGQVQKLFGGRYGVPEEEFVGAFDKLFEDDEVFDIGVLKAIAIHLPGHTPDHLGYKIGGTLRQTS